MRVTVVAIAALVVAIAVAGFVWQARTRPRIDKTSAPGASAWQVLDGLPGLPDSYAESASAQLAVVDRAAYLRTGFSGAWMKLVVAFRPEQVRAAGTDLYLFGSEALASTGAPLFLRVAPTPSDVVPVSCEARDFATFGGVGVIACERAALLSTDGLKSFSAAGGNAEGSGTFEAATVSRDLKAWVARSSNGSSWVLPLNCADCSVTEVPHIRITSLRAGDVAGSFYIAGYDTDRGGPAFVVVHQGKVVTNLGHLDGCGDGEALVLGPAAAYYACRPARARPDAPGRVIRTLDEGRSFGVDPDFDPRISVTALWGGEGWLVAVGSGHAWRRATR